LWWNTADSRSSADPGELQAHVHVPLIETLLET